MWNYKNLRRLDFRLVAILILLMGLSLLVLSSTTSPAVDGEWAGVITPHVKKQVQFFLVGWIAFLFLSGIDYHKLRDWTWILYVGMLVALLGLFFVPSIQNVHRWYRIGGFTLQPSEHAKLIVVLALSWFLEKKGAKTVEWKTVFQGLAVLMVPFALIYKQPDLGTALVLLPIGLGMFYFGKIRRGVLVLMGSVALLGLSVSTLLFFNILDHEELRPFATKVIKEYQYERLNPNTYHQKAAQTAIALGGVWGTGWRKSEFTRGQWLPAAHTDSVFPAFAEEFGLVGVALMMALFVGLIARALRVAAVAKDSFGRLLAAGIAIYLAIHIVMNLGMMSGFLPITGVPLVVISYGGSSILAIMSALGILQSIYTRRFTFS